MSIYTGRTKDEAMINAMMGVCKPCCYGGSGNCVGVPCCGGCDIFLDPEDTTPLFATVTIEDYGTKIIQLNRQAGPLSVCPPLGHAGGGFAPIVWYRGSYSSTYSEPAFFGTTLCYDPFTPIGADIITEYSYDVILRCMNPYPEGVPFAPLVNGKCSAWRLDIDAVYNSGGVLRGVHLQAAEDNGYQFCPDNNTNLILEGCSPVTFTTATGLITCEGGSGCSHTPYVSMVGKSWHVEINE